MKRLLCLVAILTTSVSLLAQEPNNAAALAARREAARQEAEEQYRKMASDIETLTANNQRLQEKISRLAEELTKLREDQARAAAASANNGVREDLKMLADKIVEVDEKRKSDKKAISEEIQTQIRKLESAVEKAASVPAPRPTTRIKEQKDDVPVSDKGYPYTVQAGDRLDLIVKAANAEFKSKGMKTITQKQMMAANPGVKWDRIQPNQKIVIPAPLKDKE